MKSLDNVKVFLGSTFEDLVDHRARCISVLNKKCFEWVGMERWGANTVPPLEFCLAQVRESAIYLGIFGTRYGHVDEATGRSITELEYREAKRLVLPCLIYLIDTRAKVTLRDVEEDSDKARKLHQLKEELRDSTKGHVVGRFTTAEDLAMNLAVDIDKAKNMLEKHRFMAGLREQIDKSIADGVRFICEMENRPSGGWSYYTLGVGTCWDTAFSLLAPVASGEEGLVPYLHRGQHWLIQRQNRFGGWGSSFEHNPDATTTIDTALGLIALRESGYEEKPHTIQRTADYLREAQQPDGGWSFTVGAGSSKTGATAWVVRSLICTGLSPSDWAAQRALSWLKDHQRFDGGWAEDKSHPVSTIGETCDALMGLNLFQSQDTAVALEAARAWLLRARGEQKSAQFGAGMSHVPKDVNAVVENVLLFLEAAFHSAISPGNEMVRADLEWLAGRRLWSNTPRAVWCLSQYRKWVS
jgi:hypothetical protein